MFVLYHHKEGESYVDWCQVEKRRMEVERERWNVEARERMKAVWQRRVDEEWKEFWELYERKCLEEWQRREKKIKEEEEKASQRTDIVESSEEDDDEEKEKKERKKN